MTHFVQIARFSFPYEYAVLRLLLEQKQIRFFFQNETVASILPVYTPSKGGILLKVHPDDLAAAQKILDDFLHSGKLKIV